MANLLSNGTFDTDTASWTNTDSTLTSVSGGIGGTNALKIANVSTSLSGIAYQDVTTEVGKAYTVFARVKLGTVTNFNLQAGTSANYTLHGSSSFTTANLWGVCKIGFVATTTTTRISLRNFAVGGNATADSFVDNVFINTTQELLNHFNVNKNGLAGSKRMLVPFWVGGTLLDLTKIDMTGTLTGTVSIAGGAPVLAGIQVVIMDRKTKKVVAATRPDSNGAFSFSGLDKTNPNRYFVVCEGPTNYNSIIYDKMNVT